MPANAGTKKKISPAQVSVPVEKAIPGLKVAKIAGRGKAAGAGPYGRADANTGRCTVCGRSDVPLKSGQEKLGFHYSPMPCELPCSGGPVGTPEDHSHGIHSEACPNCSLRTTA